MEGKKCKKYRNQHQQQTTTYRLRHKRQRVVRRWRVHALAHSVDGADVDVVRPPGVQVLDRVLDVVGAVGEGGDRRVHVVVRRDARHRLRDHYADRRARQQVAVDHQPLLRRVRLVGDVGNSPGDGRHSAQQRDVDLTQRREDGQSVLQRDGVSVPRDRLCRRATVHRQRGAARTHVRRRQRHLRGRQQTRGADVVQVRADEDGITATQVRRQVHRGRDERLAWYRDDGAWQLHGEAAVRHGEEAAGDAEVQRDVLHLPHAEERRVQVHVVPLDVVGQQPGAAVKGRHPRHDRGRRRRDVDAHHGRCGRLLHQLHVVGVRRDRRAVAAHSVVRGHARPVRHAWRQARDDLLPHVRRDDHRRVQVEHHDGGVGVAVQRVDL